MLLLTNYQENYNQIRPSFHIPDRNIPIECRNLLVCSDGGMNLSELNRFTEILEKYSKSSLKEKQSFEEILREEGDPQRKKFEQQMGKFQVCYSDLISRPVTFASKLSAAPEQCRRFFNDVFYYGFLGWLYSIENASWFVKEGRITNDEGIKSVLGAAYIKDCKGPDKECERKKKEFERKFNKANETATQLKAGWKKTNQTVADLTKGWKKTNQTVTQLEAGWEETNRTVSELREKLENANQTATQLETGWEETNRTITELREKLDNANQTATQLETGWEETNRTITELREKLENANQTAIERKESLNSCLEKKDHFEEQLKNITEIASKYNELLKTCSKKETVLNDEPVDSVSAQNVTQDIDAREDCKPVLFPGINLSATSWNLAGVVSIFSFIFFVFGLACIKIIGQKKKSDAFDGLKEDLESASSNVDVSEEDEESRSDTELKTFEKKGEGSTSNPSAGPLMGRPYRQRLYPQVPAKSLPRTPLIRG